MPEELRRLLGLGYGKANPFIYVPFDAWLFAIHLVASLAFPFLSLASPPLLAFAFLESHYSQGPWWL